MAEMWSGLVWAALRDLNTRLVAVLPSILAMLTLAAVGLVAAWVAALLLKRLARALAFDQRAETWGLVSPITRAGLRRSPSQLLAIMVFWAIFVLFLTLAVDALAIPGAGRVTDFVFAWVPRILGSGRDLPRRLARGELPRRRRADRGRQRRSAPGAAPGPRGALGSAALRQRHRGHPPRHRQGDGAGRLRHHVRRADPGPGPGLRPRGARAGPTRSWSAGSAKILTLARRSHTCESLGSKSAPAPGRAMRPALP